MMSKKITDDDYEVLIMNEEKTEKKLEYTNKTKLMCVTYTDEYSVDKKAIKDLMISFEREIFAAGSRRLNTFQNGDYIIICASKESGKVCFLSKIIERVDILKDWHNEGGKKWDYNFKITPVTGITDISNKNPNKKKMTDILENIGLKKNNLFNSRFCSEKLINGLSIIVEKGLFKPVN